MARSKITRRELLRGALTAAAGQAGGLFAAALPTPAIAQGRPARTLLRIVSSQGNQAAVMQELMKAQGYLEELGIEPEILTVGDGTKLIGAVLGGGSDICIFSGFNQLFPAIERGAKLKIIAGASITGQQAVFSGRPEVKSVKDLAGRTVGVGAIGAQLHQVMVALLRKKGVDPASVLFQNVGSSGDVFRAIAAKTVDAGPAQADIFSQASRYNIHRLEDGVFATDLPEYTWQASFATDRAIQEKRDVLVRVLAAYCRLYRLVQGPGSRDAFIKARLVALGGKDDAATTQEAIDQWNYVQTHKIYAPDLLISEERIRWMQALNIEVGSQKTIMPMERVADMSLARDAVAMIGG
jgi:ABC-type nitrate/sulfonate/bicarbonate transport system substrate-binding protein